MSIHWPILKTLALNPRRIAVVDDRRSYKSVEILAAAMHVARAISVASSEPHIGLMLPTSGAFPIAALATWMLGRVAVPLNYLLKPEELQFVVDDCGCDCIVTVKAMLDHLGEGNTPRGCKLIVLDDLNFKSFPPLRWPRSAGNDDLGVLLYTSGTSGKPKGVMLTHGNIRANVEQVLAHVEISSRDVVAGILPQFHSFGMTVLTIMPLTIGAKVIYTARFIPGRIVKLFREHKPTVFIAIPSMYNALLHVKDAQREDFASLKYVVSGGEPLPAAVQKGFQERFGITINEGYGLTETAPVSNWCRPHEYRPGSVGKALASDAGAGSTRAPLLHGRPLAVQERIVSIETGQDLPPNSGQEGEIRIGGPNVMKGYYNRPDETKAAFDEQGFLRTGDIGKFDADGHLFITGRLKEMLIVGGENVFPREIEEVLNHHPSVKDSGVVGRKDPMRGEVPIAFVEMRPDLSHAESSDAGGAGGAASGAAADTVVKMAFDEKALIKWCREHLAGYKVPDEIRVVDALPRNPTGKVMRRELKNLL